MNYKVGFGHGPRKHGLALVGAKKSAFDATPEGPASPPSLRDGSWQSRGPERGVMFLIQQAGGLSMSVSLASCTKVPRVDALAARVAQR